MKNTFCLTRDRYAFLSHYIGEMENWETYQDYQKAIDHYRALFRIKPIAIAYDMHPDYLTTHYALEQIAKGNLLGIPVQHHHAHLVACLAENGLSPQERVAGLIYDGTGYGNDGTIWGGEVLLGNCNEFERLYYLTPVPLPGGDITIRKPARMALSYLWAWGLPWSEDLSPIQALTEAEISTLRIQLERKSNTFQTSSMGRLFDAVSALIGVRQSISYEAQAAVELEAVADPEEMGYYPWKVEGQQINMKPMLEAVLADLTKNESKARIAARFHNTIAQMSLQIAQQIRQDWNINQIVLSGGVWQNRFLLEKTIQLLNNNGLQPLVHRQTPPNDGCVAFGQALIAACQLRQNKE